MDNRTEILAELEILLKRKKSKAFYATKLGISLSEVDNLLKELSNKPTENTVEPGEEVLKFNLEKGTIETSSYYTYAPSEEDIIKRHKINTKNYKLSSFWSKSHAKGFLVSALFSKISNKETFSLEFTDFLKGYTPKSHLITVTSGFSPKLSNGCLVLNQQDLHANKYDIAGENDITDRFDRVLEAYVATINKAKITNKLDKIIYVIGSDCFNSEFNNMTTKGTPQQNILPYHVSFQAICDFQTKVVDTLLANCNEVEIIYMPGNHDEYVGFHMISWLKAYYRNQSKLSVDISTDYTKYRQYSNTAMCFNHGDVQKPIMLAQNFPVEFKYGWATSDHYAIFTGDKHHELVKSMGAIKFYQLPSLSKSKSNWDSKQGYSTTPAEMISFLITEKKGITSIFKEII